MKKRAKRVNRAIRSAQKRALALARPADTAVVPVQRELAVNDRVRVRNGQIHGGRVGRIIAVEVTSLGRKFRVAADDFTRFWVYETETTCLPNERRADQERELNLAHALSLNAIRGSGPSARWTVALQAETKGARHKGMDNVDNVDNRIPFGWIPYKEPAPTLTCDSAHADGMTYTGTTAHAGGQ